MEKILIYLADKYHGCLKYWWLLLVLGIILLLLGVMIFVFPLLSYMTISMLFGITILISGIFYLVMSGTKTLKGRGWLFVAGLIELLFGIFLTLWPAVSATILPYLLGFWLLFKGFTLIGGLFSRSTYEGDAYGLTVGAGYALMLAARWNIDFGAGIMVGYTDYIKYDCPVCGKITGAKRGFIVAPDNLQIQLSYLF